jgi:hypothetical protein
LKKCPESPTVRLPLQARYISLLVLFLSILVSSI